MEVDKTQFDALLGKLIKAKPLPKAAIPKRVQRKANHPKASAQDSKSER